MIIIKYDWTSQRTTENDRVIAKNLMVAFNDTINFEENDRTLILKEIRYLTGYSLPKICVNIIKSYIISPQYKYEIEKNNYLPHSYLENSVTIGVKRFKKEVQSHGFIWEKEILMNVYGATSDELKNIPYTSKVDLPAHLNRISKNDIYVKTTCNKNTVCMADSIRLFDAVNSNTTIHLVVISYKQENNTKIILNIIEVDLTNSTELLFGTLCRNKLVELDTLVKKVPQKRKPTKEEHDQIYNMKQKLQELSGAIYLNIKCNSTQSRLQCSFNNFIKFINENPTRVIATSNNNTFRGGNISSSIISPMRKFK